MPGTQEELNKHELLLAVKVRDVVAWIKAVTAGVVRAQV